MIRHPASLIFCAALSLLVTGCWNQPAPPPPRPPYPDLGLKKDLPEFLKGTIMERTELGNTGDLAVTSYGLVVNLRHSGDTRVPTPVRDWMIKEMYRHGFGSKLMPEYTNITPERDLADKRNAIAIVGGFIPPGARIGQRVDVLVQAIPGNDTASLAGGTLYQTDLRLNGANPLNPGGSVNAYITARGSLFINPAYALEVPKVDQGPARAGARTATILGGGVVTTDRPIHLRLRTPQWNISRAVETVIDQRFQDTNVAAAVDEGYIHLYVPHKYNGDWEHFTNVVNHLYINITPSQAAIKAQVLASEAIKPNAPLENISYAWEALGTPAIPFLTPLLAHQSPEIQFAAARAGAFLGDMASEDVMMRMSKSPGHPFRLNAIATLGKLPPNSEICRTLTTCLDSEESLVRIEAYKVLSKMKDPRLPNPVYTQNVNNTFLIDVIESKGPPMVYASRVGEPRIAFFGSKTQLAAPMVFTAFDTQLSITSHPSKSKVLTIFYRGDEVQQPVSTLSGTSAIEVTARLGGADEERKLRFGYGEVVAILQSLTEQGKLPAAFVMQDLPSVEDQFAEADAATSSGRAPGEPEPANTNVVGAGNARQPANGNGASSGRPN